MLKIKKLHPKFLLRRLDEGKIHFGLQIMFIAENAKPNKEKNNILKRWTQDMINFWTQLYEI